MSGNFVEVFRSLWHAGIKLEIDCNFLSLLDIYTFKRSDKSAVSDA